MRVADYERMCLGAALIDRGAARILLSELPETAFWYGPDDTPSDVHKTIFRAIQAVIVDGMPPDVGTVAAKLGTGLSNVGGNAYLTRLAQTLPDFGIYSTAGLPQWAQTVDAAGRLRQLKHAVDEQADALKDFDDVLQQVDDVDQYIADFLEDVSHANTAKVDYSPIRLAVQKARSKLEGEAEGKAVSWFPIGWPSFNDYRLLPYRSLFVLLGLSSMGKSQLLAQILLGSAIQIRRHDLPGCVVLNTYEMGGDKYVLRMASCLSGVDLLSRQMQDTKSDEYHRIMDTLDMIDTLPIYFNDGDMTSFQILNQTMLLGAQHGGVKVVGIDYSELVPDKGGDSEEQRVSGIFRNAKNLSRTADEPCVIILSQLNAGSSDKVNKTMLGAVSQTRYSKVGLHAADVSAILYNPPQMRRAAIPFELHSACPDGDMAYLFIGKNKDGRLGWVPLDWTPECTRFADPALMGYGMSTLYEGLAEVQQNLGVETEGDF